jgi:hypothetical protein
MMGTLNQFLHHCMNNFMYSRSASSPPPPPLPPPPPPTCSATFLFLLPLPLLLHLLFLLPLLLAHQIEACGSFFDISIAPIATLGRRSLLAR